ncbi:lysostaphin resistance A-like protein [Microbacterium sp.]|uniref:CPBP family intramembrane glutamic endopeptidase n=1 Tax=Microbacterium sp. TaxID=51671 RepID=UPI003F70E0AD
MESATRQVRVAAGRRIAIVLVGAIVIWTLMVWVSLSVFGGAVTPLSRTVCALLVFCLVVPMIVFARRFLDRRPWTGLMLQALPEAWRPFLLGVASFLIPSAVGLSIALVTGWLRVTSVLPPLELVAAISFTILTVLLLEAIPEELIFRGYIYRNLSATIAPIAAVFVQAVLFALLGTTLWVVTAGWGILLERGAIFLTMGVVLGVLRLIARSVWTPIGFHLAFQVVAQTLLTQSGIEVSNPGAITIAGMIPPFVLAVTISLVLTRSWPRPNWRELEPEQGDSLGASGS